MNLVSTSRKLLEIRGPFSGATQCILKNRMNRDQTLVIFIKILMEFRWSSRIGLLSNENGGVRGVDYRWFSWKFRFKSVRQVAEIGGGRQKELPEKWAEQGPNERALFGGPRNSLKFSGQIPGARGGVLENSMFFEWNSVKFVEFQRNRNSRTGHYCRGRSQGFGGCAEIMWNFVGMLEIIVKFRRSLRIWWNR